MLCKKCNTEKTEADFYAGNKWRCKECIKAGVRANREANLERYRAFDRARASQPHRVAARKAYQRTAAFSASHDAAVKRWAAKHPERQRASTAVHNAVRDGRLIPWPVCAVPECCGRPHGHHPDYSRPLDVVWLCDKHHKEVHAMVARA
jgi:hypothetical protein